jgi:ACR3 family arsenite transporter
MAAGLAFGKLVPSAVQSLRGFEFGRGSQINVPIALLIWLMITPMMMKVDFGAIRNVGRKPAGLVVTLIVNWLVKPFSMAFLAWLFFRFVFSDSSRPPKRISTLPVASFLPPPPVPRWCSSGAI